MLELIKLTHTNIYNIYYEDTDFSGFVYHANYLKFFERSRSDLMGISALKELFDAGYHFVVSKAVLDFKAPARFGEQIIVDTHAEFTRSPRVHIKHILKNSSQITLVIGEITLAMLDKHNKPARIPDNFLIYLKHKNNS
jgi:acyl-CoA thioester hydrolase